MHGIRDNKKKGRVFEEAFIFLFTCPSCLSIFLFFTHSIDEGGGGGLVLHYIRENKNKRRALEDKESSSFHVPLPSLISFSPINRGEGASVTYHATGPCPRSPTVWCVCVIGSLQTCVNQSDMIIFTSEDRPFTSPSKSESVQSNLRPRSLNYFVTSTVSWITGAGHNA